MKIRLVAQGGTTSKVSLAAALKESLANTPIDRLDVAVAYATMSGVTALEMVVGQFPPVTRWVVGLDDAITQPAAIERLFALPGAEVRLAALTGQGRRFHPKIYCLWSSTVSDCCVLSVGSGNMTLNGLRRNGEAAAILSASSAKDVSELKAVWDEMWLLGAPLTPQSLADYKDRYKVARRARKAVTAAGAAPPEPDIDEFVDVDQPLNGDPNTAIFAWLDVGSATAQGREVELPQAVVPYFGVGSQAHSTVQLQLRPKKGGPSSTLPLTMRADNSMWRIAFTQSAISALTGRNTFRPLAGGNRSDLAIVFERTGLLQYNVECVLLASPDYQSLITKSTAAGALFRTMNTATGRNFGFF